MLKSVMNDDEQAFSTVMVLIFQKLCSLHVGSCAERLCMNDRGGNPCCWVWCILRNTAALTTFLHVSLTSEHTRNFFLNVVHPRPFVRAKFQPVLHTPDKLNNNHNAQGAQSLSNSSVVPRMWYAMQFSVLQCMLQQCTPTQTSFEGFCSSV